MRRIKAQIYYIQEAHSSVQVEKLWQRQWGQGKAIFAHWTTAKRGCAIFFGKGFDPEVLEKYSDTEGRYLFLKIRWNAQIWHLINLYAPNDEEDQIEYYEKIHKLIMEK